VGVTKQPELTFLLGFWVMAGDSFLLLFFLCGIYHYVSYVGVTGGIFPTPQKKKKTKRTKNQWTFCKWKLVGSFFLFFLQRKIKKS
jgi:hypothetical protein